MKEEKARKFKSSASKHFHFTRIDMFCENNKEAWKYAKRLRKYYSKFINQLRK